MKIRQPREMLQSNLIVKHLAGSKAYGTSLPTSDTDFRGIFCADEVWYKSPWYNVKEIDIAEEEDTKFYELGRFMKLLVDQNPNIVETLWVDESSVVQTTPAYEYLRSQRDKLLSSKTAFTFSGYAVSQLKRIKGHNKWINNPQPEEPPRQIDHLSLVVNFTEGKVLKMDGDNFAKNYHKGYMLVPYGGEIYGLYNVGGNYETFDQLFTLNTNSDVDRQELGVPDMVLKFNKEEYRRCKEVWHNYWTWKRERNETRSELEELYGYDTKHAMHLVRLLRMGKEILTEGHVHVLRPDASELLEIRNGKLTYEEIVEYAEAMDREIKDVHYKSAVIPSRVDVKVATEILFETQRLVWE